MKATSEEGLEIPSYIALSLPNMPFYFRKWLTRSCLTSSAQLMFIPPTSFEVDALEKSSMPGVPGDEARRDA
eukprot:1421777-Amphidinium_carterae.1